MGNSHVNRHGFTEGSGFFPISGLSCKAFLAGLSMGKKNPRDCVFCVYGEEALLLIRHRSYE
jgi:hypothetical protein